MRKKIVSLLLLGLPCFPLAELWAHQHFHEWAPREAEWKSLKPAILALKRPNDLITVVPRWGEPLLRQALGEAGTPIEVLARADDETLERVIEISFDGERVPSFRDWLESARTNAGPFAIRVLENPRYERARERLLDRLTPESLEVFEGSGRARLPCPFTSIARPSAGNLGGEPSFGPRRFACPSGEPHFVTVTTIDDQNFEPRRCIWAHPSRRGPLTLRFRDVWLGQKLVGHAGLPWLLSRDGAGTPIRFEASFEGQSVGAVVVEDTKGWQRFEWSTADQRDRRGLLELTVSTADPRARRFCFTLESR